jgi:hypothetical protein
MNFHGGAYCDIKRPSGSWLRAFDDLEASDAWMNGYPEVDGGAAMTAYAKLKYQHMSGKEREVYIFREAPKNSLFHL